MPNFPRLRLYLWDLRAHGTPWRFPRSNLTQSPPQPRRAPVQPFSPTPLRTSGRKKTARPAPSKSGGLMLVRSLPTREATSGSLGTRTPRPVPTELTQSCARIFLSTPLLVSECSSEPLLARLGH